MRYLGQRIYLFCDPIEISFGNAEGSQCQSTAHAHGIIEGSESAQYAVGQQILDRRYQPGLIGIELGCYTRKRLFKQRKPALEPVN
jgi:hypothetical protein